MVGLHVRGLRICWVSHWFVTDIAVFGDFRLWMTNSKRVQEEVMAVDVRKFQRICP